MGFRADPQLRMVREAIKAYPQQVEQAEHVLHYLAQLKNAQEYGKDVVTHFLPAAEEALSHALVKKALFELAWRGMNAEEQKILSTYHWQEHRRYEAVEILSGELYCSASTVERKYRKSLQKLQLLLYAWSDGDEYQGLSDVSTHHKTG